MTRGPGPNDRRLPRVSASAVSRSPITGRRASSGDTGETGRRDVSRDSDCRPTGRARSDRNGPAKAMTLPLKDLGLKRRLDEYFECPVCGIVFATLADFDNHRKDER